LSKDRDDLKAMKMVERKGNKKRKRKKKKEKKKKGNCQRTGYPSLDHPCVNWGKAKTKKANALFPSLAFLINACQYAVASPHR